MEKITSSALFSAFAVQMNAGVTGKTVTGLKAITIDGKAQPNLLRIHLQNADGTGKEALLIGLRPLEAGAVVKNDAGEMVIAEGFVKFVGRNGQWMIGPAPVAVSATSKIEELA